MSEIKDKGERKFKGAAKMNEGEMFDEREVVIK